MKEINNGLTNSLRLGPLEVGPGGPAHRIPPKKENETLRKCKNDRDQARNRPDRSGASRRRREGTRIIAGK